MENGNMNEKANINDDLLVDVSGGYPGLMGTAQCSVCGKYVPKVNLEVHHLQKVCKICLVKLSNKE